MNDAHGMHSHLASSSGTASSGELLPELHERSFVRLGLTALSYSLVYALAFGLSWLLSSSPDRPEWKPSGFDLMLACGSILLGLVVAVLARARRLPAHVLSSISIGFLLLASLGISAGAWGWERRFLEIPYGGGVPWVCVWILVFPNLITGSSWRVLSVGLVAALTVPAVLLGSPLLNGLPPGIDRSELLRLVALWSFPGFICAGLAAWTAGLLYRLGRDVTRARRLGSYELVSLLGHGGMGEVWRARHRMLVRPAAIKLIRPESLGGRSEQLRTIQRRFEREAQATAALSSPHTVELYDFGLTDDGIFYYVMELLDGIDLRSMVERYGPLPAARCVHLLRQACHSLADAHARGLVHRDVKPANLLACRLGLDHDVLKVLDFGLVKPLGQPPGDNQLTIEGTLSGTPGYMAPEIADGERAIDSRFDIYALGCVAHWLLTGRQVFEAETALALLLKHVKEPVPRVSAHVEVPAQLDDLVLECLAKDPDQRPASVLELRKRLHACERETGRWNEEQAAVWWHSHVPPMAESTAPRAGAEPTLLWAASRRPRA